MYHILIVDEEEHLLWALERNLFPERDDIVVHTASSGEGGLETLEEETIDLLISDIKMPGDVDGFQLILRAKEKVPDARVMIITAFGTHRIKNFAERIGISHYIEKPFTVDELRNAVLEILDEKEGFQGVLSDLELTDIIQMLCLAKRTALLHLKHRDHRGRIIFDAGDVVHAEFDGDVGPEAVYTMLDLRQGDIFMQSDFDIEDRTIDMGWQDLLLEGVKRTDEQRLEKERERARQELGEDDQPGGPGEEVDEDGDWNRDSAGRTKTPMGMGAPAMEDEAQEEPGLEESSGGMLFSEEELEEISRASEAAIEETDTVSPPESEEEATEEEEETPEEEETAEEETAEEETPEEETPEEEAEPQQEEALDGDAEQAVDGDGTADDSGYGIVELGDNRAPQGEQEGVEVEAASVQEPEPKPEPSPTPGSEFPSNGEIEQQTPEREEAPTVEVSKEMFAVAVQETKGGADSSPDGAATEATNSRTPDGANGSPSQSTEPATRQRSGTSPGMATVKSEGPTTEESGEFEMFAAPALNGPPSDDEIRTGGVPAEAVTVVEEFVGECPGLKATAILSTNAEVEAQHINLAYDDGFDVEALTSGLADVFARAQRSVKALQDGDAVDELQLVLDDEYLLMRSVAGKALVHVAIVDRQVSLGIALVLMREFGKRYAQM